MMPRICAVLPCSAALARQIHHPDTRRVISWGLGTTAATRGDLYERETTRRVIITSPLTVHTRPHTHTRLLRTCKSCARLLTAEQSACPTTQEHDQSPFIRPHLKHVAQPITVNRCHLQVLWKKIPVWAKISPMQLILIQTSSQGNFRFAALQLLEIQSSSGS